MDSRIEKVLNYIDGHLSENLNLSKIAKLACMSDSQFHRLFKKSTGFTPFKFIEKLRLNYAYQQLIEEPQVIQSLSEQYGYKYYETFSRSFKKEYGLSPDDLAKIISYIRSVSLDTEEVFLAAVDAYDIEEIRAKLQQVCNDLSMTQESLKNASVYVVNQAEQKQKATKGLIKNKFNVVADKNLLAKLLKGDEL